MAFGWHAKPMLLQIGAAPSAPRVHLTHSSVHALQFGWLCCTGISFGADCGVANGRDIGAGGIGRSAANALPLITVIKTAARKLIRRILGIRLSAAAACPLRARQSTKMAGLASGHLNSSIKRSYFQSTFVTS
ncbi:MAG: hypothetical protein HY242_16240 [Afipia sp.]|nr:hypothetical protein [Afipia sp.]